MTTMAMKEISIPFEATLDILKADEDEQGRWILEGFASTTDEDLQLERVTQDAIDASASDLEKNSTVLLHHDQKEPIGRVLESEARKGGLWIKVLISKTVPDTWTKIKEGVLNKFSIRGKVIDAVKEWSEKLKRFVKVIKKMFLVEVSLVSVPANPNAKALGWYIEKAFDIWESEGGKLQTINKTGGQIMDGQDGTATVERTEKDGVPEIVKDEELVKAATAHAALVKEKTEAVAKIAGELASGAAGMTSQELQAKLSQLADLGWKIGDDVRVVHAMGETAKSEGDETEKARGEGMGVGGPRQGDGGASTCVCPDCGETISHSRGTPCQETKCPKCGTMMIGKSEDATKGFPAPDSLLAEWGEFCKTKGIADELDDEKVFEKWVEFCKEHGYPEPFAYPYSEIEKADEKVKEVIFLVDKLIAGADEKTKPILKQIKALLSRMMGGAYPYPTPYPYPKKKALTPEEEEEEKKKKKKEEEAKKDGGGDEDIEKKGAKMKSVRLSTLKSIIEKLQTLAEDLAPELAKKLETMTKNLADETKAEESLEELKKTLAVEARQTLSELMEPIEKRLERIETIEGIQKSEKGQEKTPDEKAGTKDGDAEEGGGKTPSVWSGILGDSLKQAKSGFKGKV